MAVGFVNLIGTSQSDPCYIFYAESTSRYLSAAAGTRPGGRSTFVAHESRQSTLPGSEPCFARFPALLIPFGAFLTVHPCTVRKGFGFLPRPFAALRAVNPDSTALLGSSNGRKSQRYATREGKTKRRRSREGASPVSSFTTEKSLGPRLRGDDEKMENTEATDIS